jgi:hypothetical protein
MNAGMRGLVGVLLFALGGFFFTLMLAFLFDSSPSQPFVMLGFLAFLLLGLGLLMIVRERD